MLIAALWASQSAFGFELSNWEGVWERFDEKGKLVERINAKEQVPGSIMTSQIEYFANDKSVAKGASIMSKQGDNIAFSFHVSGGTVIQAEALDSTNNSMFLKLEQSNKARGQSQTVFTRFTLLSENGKDIMRQDLFSDEKAANKTMSVVFKKVG